MRLDTPEGVLTIEGDTLTFVPADNGDTVTVSLNPVPEYRYERSIYETGSLVIDGHAITLNNSQAEAVVTELRRASKPKATKAVSDK